MERVPLKELISLLEKELVRMHYKEATLNYYRVNWIRLIRYFENRNEEFYSETVAMEYVDEITASSCGRRGYHIRDVPNLENAGLHVYTAIAILLPSTV